MGNANREAVIQISARIAVLRETLARAKDELKQAEGQLDRLLENDGEVSISPPAPNSLGAQWFAERDTERSLNQQIIAFLNSTPEKDFASEEIFGAFPDAKQDTIRSALVRLADSRKIARTKRGRYQSIIPSLIPPVSEPVSKAS